MAFMAIFMAISRKEISLNVRALRGHASLAARPMTPRAGTACIIKIDATARSPDGAMRDYGAMRGGRGTFCAARLTRHPPSGHSRETTTASALSLVPAQ
jgi:hypothetical protein